MRVDFQCDPHQCVAERAVERPAHLGRGDSLLVQGLMSVPIAGEARPIYPRYSAGSPTYLRHEARCPAPTRAGVMSRVAPRLVGRHCAGSACGLFLVRAAFRRPSDPFGGLPTTPRPREVASDRWDDHPPSAVPPI